MSWIRGQQDVPSLHYILTCKQKARTAASRAPLHWQPLSVHIWAHCNPLIAHDMNDVWKVDHTTAETSATLFEQWWGFFYVAFDLTINERRMKETNSTFPPPLIPILTLPAPLSPLTTMDWFLVSISLLISQNAFCPTANIWGGSSLIGMDKSKNKWKISFHDAWCICHEGKWKKDGEKWKKDGVILHGYWPWRTILSLSINFLIQTYSHTNAQFYHFYIPTSFPII